MCLIVLRFLYGVTSCESMIANIKDALVELDESYNALYGMVDW